MMIHLRAKPPGPPSLPNFAFLREMNKLELLTWSINYDEYFRVKPPRPPSLPNFATLRFCARMINWELSN
jgi:hypothetical protein